MTTGLWVEADFSRFDSTVSKTLLEFEHAIYRHYLDSQQLDELLAVQMYTRAFSDEGLSYSTVGRRCSGDANTSIGNGLLNRFCHWLAWRDLPDWVSFHEGDDALAHVPDRPVYLARLQAVAESLGFKIKVKSTRVVADTVFCGRVNYLHDGALRTMCDLPRTMNKFHVTTVNVPPGVRGVNARKALLKAKALSYYCTDSATPIIGVLCVVLVRLLDCAPDWSDLSWGRPRYHGDVDFCDIPLQARLAYAHRYNITEHTQVALENYYKSWLELGYIPSLVAPLICDGADTPIALESSAYFQLSYF